MSKSFYEKHEETIERLLNWGTVYSGLSLSVALLVASVFSFVWGYNILSFIMFVVGVCLTYRSGILAEREVTRRRNV